MAEVKTMGLNDFNSVQTEKAISTDTVLQIGIMFLSRILTVTTICITIAFSQKEIARVIIYIMTMVLMNLQMPVCLK